MIANFIYNWSDLRGRRIAEQFGYFTIDRSNGFVWLLFFGILFYIWIGCTIGMP